MGQVLIVAVLWPKIIVSQKAQNVIVGVALGAPGHRLKTDWFMAFLQMLAGIDTSNDTSTLQLSPVVVAKPLAVTWNSPGSRSTVVAVMVTGGALAAARLVMLLVIPVWRNPFSIKTPQSAF